MEELLAVALSFPDESTLVGPFFHHDFHHEMKGDGRSAQ